MNDKLPPQDLEAEGAALGSLLALGTAEVSWTFEEFTSILKPEAFVDPDNRAVYKAVLATVAAGKPIDMVAVLPRLQGEPTNGQWQSVLIGLYEQVPDVCNGIFYARKTADCYHRREAIRKATRLTDELFDPNFDLTSMATVAEDLAALSNSGGTLLARRPMLKSASEVNIMPVRWIWRDRVPAGMLTIFTGLPDCGKSSVCIDMAARLSRGTPWPDRREEPISVGETIYISGEDSIERVLVPRLMAANADLARVHFLEGVHIRNGEDFLQLDKDIPTIRAAIESKPETRLLILDPLVSFVGRADTHRDAEIRQILTPLSNLADETSVAIIAIIHFKKSSDSSAIDKVSGSRGFTAAARSVWAFVREKRQGGNDVSKMLAVKSNIGPRAKGLSFELGHRVQVLNDDEVDHPDDRFAPRIHWLDGSIDDDINDLLAMERKGQNRDIRNEAADWLQETLADGPVPSKDLRRMAKECGHSWGTIRRASDELRIKPRKAGFGEGAYWVYELPNREGAQCDDDEGTQHNNVSIFDEGEQLRVCKPPEGADVGVSNAEVAQLSEDAQLHCAEHIREDDEQLRINDRPLRINGQAERSMEAFKR